MTPEEYKQLYRDITEDLSDGCQYKDICINGKDITIEELCGLIEKLFTELGWM